MQQGRGRRQYVDLGNCAKTQQRCASDNTTDVTATNSGVAANCATQAAAYTACCTSGASACQ